MAMRPYVVHPRYRRIREKVLESGVRSQKPEEQGLGTGGWGLDNSKLPILPVFNQFPD